MDGRLIFNNIAKSTIKDMGIEEYSSGGFRKIRLDGIDKIFLMYDQNENGLKYIIISVPQDTDMGRYWKAWDYIYSHGCKSVELPF